MGASSGIQHHFSGGQRIESFPTYIPRYSYKREKEDMFQELHDKQQPQETRLLQSLPGDTPQRCDSIFSFRWNFIQTLNALITPDFIIPDIRTSWAFMNCWFLTTRDIHKLRWHFPERFSQQVKNITNKQGTVCHTWCMTDLQKDNNQNMGVSCPPMLFP